MKLNRLHFPVLMMIGVMLSLSSCYDRTQHMPNYKETYVRTPRKIDLRAIRTQEEGGSRFVKFTDETELVMGPNIKENSGVIEWYGPGFISVSPDGLRIAYLAQKDKQNNIYIKNTEGGKQTVQRTFRDNVLDMAFSNDGKYIAFTERLDDDYNVYQISSEGGTAVQQITTTSNRETSPCYSMDSRQVFFTKSQKSVQSNDFVHYVWSYDRETALLTQYSEGFSPNLKNDNRTVALTRNNKETGRGEIWTIDLQSGQTTLVVSDREMGFSTPRFSPDGRFILCVGSTVATKNRRENLDLYVVRTDGSGLTQLTFHPGHDCSPVWAPDGESIYFLSQRGSEDTPKFSVWQIDFKANF